MACNLLETQLAACESGIGKLDSPIELLKIIAQLSCEIADAGGGGGGGSPGAPLNSVQFNDGGAFGGDADLTWNKTTNVLELNGTIGISNTALAIFDLLETNSAFGFALGTPTLTKAGTQTLSAGVAGIDIVSGGIRMPIGGPDVALVRQGAGVLEVNSTVAGTFRTIQAILKTSVNATASGAVVNTHTIPLTDASGTVYRCLCLV